MEAININTNYIGKKLSVKNNLYTIYAVNDYGVFAHDGDMMITDGNGIISNSFFYKYEEVEANLLKTGRPSLGKTKKVSVTLTQDQWEFVDRVLALNEFSYSQYFRMLVENDISKSNYVKSNLEKEGTPKITRYDFQNFDVFAVERIEGGRQKNAQVDISVPERELNFSITFYMVDDEDFTSYTDYGSHNLENKISEKEYLNIINHFVQNHVEKLSHEIFKQEKEPSF